MKNDTIKIILGYILLTPSIITILLFLYDLIFVNLRLAIDNHNFYLIFGRNFRDRTFGNAVIPIYFGLLAIAGSLIIKDTISKS